MKEEKNISQLVRVDGSKKKSTAEEVKAKYHIIPALHNVANNVSTDSHLQNIPARRRQQEKFQKALHC